MAGRRHMFVSRAGAPAREVPVDVDWRAQKTALEAAGAVVTVLDDDELIALGLLVQELEKAEFGS